MSPSSPSPSIDSSSSDNIPPGRSPVDPVPFPRETDQMPLSGNQPTTPRSAQSQSAYY